jgi:hypothetical protein
MARTYYSCGVLPSRVLLPPAECAVPGCTAVIPASADWWEDGDGWWVELRSDGKTWEEVRRFQGRTPVAPQPES